MSLGESTGASLVEAAPMRLGSIGRMSLGESIGASFLEAAPSRLRGSASETALTGFPDKVPGTFVSRPNRGTEYNQNYTGYTRLPESGVRGRSTVENTPEIQDYQAPDTRHV